MRIPALPGVPVLSYHWLDAGPGGNTRLYGVTPRGFAGQMRFLRAAGYRAAPLDSLPGHLSGRSPLPARTVVLTFDDGYRDNVECAGPVLEELGWTATIFVVTDRAGGTNEWDRSRGGPRREILGWDEMRRLDGRVFRFEPHSQTHPSLKRCTDATARKEIEGSKRRLEEELGRAAVAFAYPYGDVDPRLESMVREAGYLLAVTDRMGLNVPGGHPLRVRRTEVTLSDSTATFAFKVTTGFSGLDMVREAGRRMTGKPEPWEPRRA